MSLKPPPHRSIEDAQHHFCSRHARRRVRPVRPRHLPGGRCSSPGTTYTYCYDILLRYTYTVYMLQYVHVASPTAFFGSKIAKWTDNSPTRPAILAPSGPRNTHDGHRSAGPASPSSALAFANPLYAFAARALVLAVLPRLDGGAEVGRRFTPAPPALPHAQVFQPTSLLLHWGAQHLKIRPRLLLCEDPACKAEGSQ